MDEFKRPPVNRLRQNQPSAEFKPVPKTEPKLEPAVEAPQPLDLDFEKNTGLGSPKPKKPVKKVIAWVVGALLALIVLFAAGAMIWYQAQLSPVNSDNTDKQAVVIESGTTPDGIAKILKDENLIKSESAFFWYTRLNGVQNNLQAGTYRLSQSESLPEIVQHMVDGKVDTFSITFIPGETLAKNREVLISAGYDEAEVDAALVKNYDSPLFEGKPASADLEGYIYGETYSFSASASVEDILEYIFDYYYNVIEENDLIAKYKAQDLSLFEGIILASIVQKEAVGGDEAQIAQVFLKRHSIGMALGSDPTYQYIADKLGQERDINFDSPYNTRRYAGLPPGPIANPGLTSLKAIANPADGDYLYFLSGDDDVTYYAHTFEEHEANIRNHCQVKCQMI